MNPAEYKDLVSFFLLIGLIIFVILYISTNNNLKESEERNEDQRLYIEKLKAQIESIERLNSSLRKENESLKIIPPDRGSFEIYSQPIQKYRVYSQTPDDRQREGKPVKEIKRKAIEEALKPIREVIDKHMTVSPDRDSLIVDFEYHFNFLHNNNV